MRLKKIDIVKFRNLSNVSFEIPEGKKAIVFSGLNGIGKTTMIDSVMWTLCDETLVYGKENSDNLDKNNRQDTVEVTCLFVKDNGDELELKRKLYPKYTKSGEFSSYANEFYINGAEYSSKKYFARLLNDELGVKIENDPDVSSFNTLRSIIDYNYISSIKYQVAREKIEKILKIAKDEVIANDTRFALIKDELKAQLYDVAKVKTKLNKKKTLAEENVKRLNNEYSILQSAYQPIDEEKLKELKAKKEAIEKTEYTHSADYKSTMAKMEEFNNLVVLAQKTMNENKSKYDIILKEVNTINNNITHYNTEIENLRNTFITIKNSSRRCPNCNFELDKESINKRLKEINEKGSAIGNTIKQLNAKLESYDLATATKDFEDSKKKYDELFQKQADFNNKLKSIIQKENDENRIFYNEKMNSINQIQGEIFAIESSSNVKGLQDKENELKIAREDLALVERQLVILDEFFQFKNEAIKQRISEVFPNLDFRLTTISDTGAVTNTCQVFLKNVDYNGVNTGNKILLGFEIINSLRKAFGVTETLPIIFDELANLDKANFQKTISLSDSQVITTIVGQTDTLKLLTM